jgi:tetratricopeptide (TPR) repeat protein
MMRCRTRWLWTVGALLLSILGYSASNVAEANNDQPLYGNQPKTREQLAADKRFIDEIVRQAGSREAGSRAFVQKGWKFIAQRDAVTAIKRFNQAWLLDPNNADAFWGLGAALGLRADYDRSLEMFESARRLKPSSARLLSDYARTYTMKASAGSASQKSDLDRAVGLSEEAARLSPNEAAVYAPWAIALFLKGDFAHAWELVHKAKDIDQGAIDPQFVADLRAKMAEPSKR